MPSFFAELLPVFFLIALGAFLGGTGFLSPGGAETLKKLVASVALPAVLFGAFSRVRPDLSLLAISIAVFASCALLGLAGSGLARALRLPRPSTVFLFQGFEAGMLGYALFAAFFGRERTNSFATADLGQVVFVFTVLMAQLLASEAGGGKAGRVRPAVLLARLAGSPAIIAIAAGLLASALLPDARGAPWGEGGFLLPLLDVVGSLTTPLVCLVVGFGLRDFRLRGAGKPIVAVVLRLLSASALGAFLAFVLVPALGYAPINSIALLVLFVLPPPFIIPVFRSKADAAAYVSAVLSIHTLVSIIAIVVLAAVSGGAA